METVKVSEILDLVKKIHKDAQTAIHYLEGRILIGEINRPEDSTVKTKRKRRTKKEMALNATAGHIKMNLEKEYQAGRTGVGTDTKLTLPDADEGKAGEFFKKKREKKPI